MFSAKQKWSLLLIFLLCVILHGSLNSCFWYLLLSYNSVCCGHFVSLVAFFVINELVFLSCLFVAVMLILMISSSHWILIDSVIIERTDLLLFSDKCNLVASWRVAHLSLSFRPSARVGSAARRCTAALSAGRSEDQADSPWSTTVRCPSDPTSAVTISTRHKSNVTWGRRETQVVQVTSIVRAVSANRENSCSV